MGELSKRLISSVILLIIFILAIKFKIMLFLILIVLFLEIFFEFNILFKKIFKFDKFKLYIILAFTLFYLFIIISITWLIFSNALNEYKLNYLFIITVCISSDVGGYIFGKIFKGKKITKISPNKTYSGMLGAFFLSIISTNLFFTDMYSFENIVFFSLLVSSISQIGDLFISFLKRKSKIKDTGNIIPGHGGLLDRFDGIIFAIPTIFLLIKI